MIPHFKTQQYNHQNLRVLPYKLTQFKYRSIKKPNNKNKF